MKKATYPTADQSKRICSLKTTTREAAPIIARLPPENQEGGAKMSAINEWYSMTGEQQFAMIERGIYAVARKRGARIDEAAEYVGDVWMRVTDALQGDADSDKLVTFSKTGIMALTAQMKEGAAKDADAKMAYEALQAIKIENKGKTATLSAATAADPALKALADKAKALK